MSREDIGERNNRSREEIGEYNLQEQGVDRVIESTGAEQSQSPRSDLSQFLTLLMRPLKGQCHRNKCGFLFY